MYMYVHLKKDVKNVKKKEKKNVFFLSDLNLSEKLCLNRRE